MQILGNEKNLKFLKESAQSGRISHAYIISGPDGTGKKTFAANAAAALLCENHKSRPEFSPCGMCASCKRALSGNHPDIIRITHEKETVLSVDEIRSQLVRDIDIKPYYGPYKIYIVEDAHLMPAQAQNALLKTIEEPPAYAVVFLLTDNADAFLDTIKSRSIKLDMQPLSSALTEKELIKEGADPLKAAEISAFSRGNLGLAKKLLSDPAAGELTDFVTDFLTKIKDADALEISKAADTLSANGSADIPDILKKWYRDVLVLKSSANRKLYFPGYKETLSRQAETLSYESINNIFTDIDEAYTRLTFNVNSKAVYEALFLRIRQNG